MVWKGSLRGPFGSENGLPLFLLRLIPFADDFGDWRGRVNGHALAFNQIEDAVVVVRMPVRQQDGEQRLPERVNLRSQRPGVGNRESAVDRNYAALPFD